MKISQQIAAFLIFAALMVREGLCTELQCYECNSYIDKKCSNPEAHKAQLLKTCDGNATACRKVEQEIYYDGDYHTRTFRQCAYGDEVGSDCKERTGTYRFKSWYCHCHGNGCNGASSVLVSFTLISATVTAFFGLRKML